ncbi:MAG TPA: phosphotransferase [Steroidobacteraceae bacterium]|nr:phosphotransferase [Steroidobacteraceae bacterium]
MTPSDAGDLRFLEITRWLAEDLGFAGSPVVPASSDASFRRYFRVTRAGESYIVMDAPPEKESLGPYLRVAAMLAASGLNVPRVLALHEARGLVLISDLGSRQYLDALAQGEDVERLYADALDALLVMQSMRRPFASELPAYDRALLMREMELLPEWFLRRHLRLDIGRAERAMLDRLFEQLLQSALAQPATFVHRDYHSRNLMIADQANPGILDFQDAVVGPLTYDLVSLLRDCYIAWPRHRVRAWALGYRRRLLERGFALAAGEEQFMRWFDMMGLQRHIKVLGIFCRLNYRDRKSQYLADLPRVLDYLRAVAAAHPETGEFAEFITSRIDGQFEQAQARALAQARAEAQPQARAPS